MKKMNELEINALFNNLLIESVNHSSGTKKSELKKLISKKYGIDEKELKKLKKDELIEKYIINSTFSTDEICEINGNIMLYSITHALDLHDKKKSDVLLKRAEIETTDAHGRDTDYPLITFSQAYKFIKYVLNNYDQAEKEEVVSVFISGKTEKGVKMACSQFFNIKEPDKLIIKYDDAYKSYSFKGNVILKEEVPN